MGATEHDKSDDDRETRQAACTPAAEPRRTTGTDVIRLTGLPARSRCPDVAVRRGEGVIEIVFSGSDAEVRMDVEERFLGGADLEAEELRLLARLREMGYRVTRAPGGRDPDPG